MNTSNSLISLITFRRGVRAAGWVVALGTAATLLQGQERRPGGPAQDGEGRRSISPQDIQARMLSNLRDRLGVTNDEEWAIISERLLKLMELRRSAPGAGGGVAALMAMRGGGGPGGDAGKGFRGSRPGGSPETEALQSALVDKLPDAEVKARLNKLRETRKANEKKLEQAQEDLRAVLTVRQEAITVLMGLLP